MCIKSATSTTLIAMLGLSPMFARLAVSMVLMGRSGPRARASDSAPMSLIKRKRMGRRRKLFVTSIPLVWRRLEVIGRVVRSVEYAFATKNTWWSATTKKAKSSTQSCRARAAAVLASPKPPRPSSSAYGTRTKKAHLPPRPAPPWALAAPRTLATAKNWSSEWHASWQIWDTEESRAPERGRYIEQSFTGHFLKDKWWSIIQRYFWIVCFEICCV